MIERLAVRVIRHLGLRHYGRTDTESGPLLKHLVAGMIMRNSVILVDQIDQEIARGAHPRQAIVEATVRRSRPVVLTAATAILAMIPLTRSVFWGPMAISIMGGLVAATALTLVFVPALYAARGRVTASAARARPILNDCSLREPARHRLSLIMPAAGHNQ